MNVLVLCSMAHIRSMYVAQMLHETGLNTRARGTDDDADALVTEDDIDWADRIVIVDKDLVHELRNRFPEPKVLPSILALRITNADWIENMLELRKKIALYIEEYGIDIWSIEDSLGG